MTTAQLSTLDGLQNPKNTSANIASFGVVNTKMLNLSDFVNTKYSTTYQLSLVGPASPVAVPTRLWCPPPNSVCFVRAVITGFSKTGGHAVVGQIVNAYINNASVVTPLFPGAPQTLFWYNGTFNNTTSVVIENTAKGFYFNLLPAASDTTDYTIYVETQVAK
jgi:hypothetical protein